MVNKALEERIVAEFGEAAWERIAKLIDREELAHRAGGRPTPADSGTQEATGGR